MFQFKFVDINLNLFNCLCWDKYAIYHFFLKRNTSLSIISKLRVTMLIQSNSNPINSKNTNYSFIVPFYSHWSVHLCIPRAKSSHVKSVPTFWQQYAARNVFEVFVCRTKLSNDLYSLKMITYPHIFSISSFA
jgi:hypothetical protein